MSDNVLAVEALSLAKSGKLHAWLVESLGTWIELQREQVYAIVLNLHVKGAFDLLDALFSPHLSWALEADYQARVELYGRLIPRIETSAASLLAAIRSVNERVWHHTLDEAFRLWCEAKPTRPDEVVQLVQDPSALDKRFLIPAIVAGYQFHQARFLALAINLSGTRSRDPIVGLYALGAIKFAGEVDRAVALTAIAAVACDSQVVEETKAIALFAAINIIAQAPNQDLTIVETLLVGLIGNPGPEVIRECAMAIARHGRVIPYPILCKLASALVSGVEQSATSLHSVDIGLYHLLALGHVDQAIDCIEHFLTSGSEQDDLIGHLGSVAHELSHGDRERLGKLLARWLATGKPALCAAARKLVSQSGNQRLTCDGNLGNTLWPAYLTVKAARKAVGWLMPHPTAPASLIVGLLREANDVVAEPLVELLLDPLLLNYPYACKEYLESARPRLPIHTQKWINIALAKHAEYMTALGTVGVAPELQPSRRHRQLEYRYRSATMNAAMREARTESPLFSVIPTSIILYGKRTICRITDLDGTERRLVNKMGSVGTEIDNAMGSIYDQDGLDFLLLSFRRESEAE